MEPVLAAAVLLLDQLGERRQAVTAIPGAAELAAGSLVGRVFDPNGAVIVGAQVKARHEPTGREIETLTSEAGIFAFRNVEVGPYTVTVHSPGFKQLVRSGLVVNIAARLNVDFTLEVGEVTTTIDVTGAPPLLATTSAEIATNFQPRLMRDVPLFVTGTRRRYDAFIAYMPGVNNGVQDSSINGGNRRSKEILIDGANMTIADSGGTTFDPPPVEQFGEFRLVTNNFAAEYGRTGGGIEIYVTRSGSNRFRGEIFEFLRNDKLDAAGWGINHRRIYPDGDPRNPTKGKVRQHEFGFALGGPVVIPKLYNGTDRTFFYVTHHRFRTSNASSRLLLTIPTTLMRQGNFSELVDAQGRPVTIFDPASLRRDGERLVRTPFPGNIIPANRFSAVSQKILDLLPPPTSEGLVRNYFGLSFNSFTRRFFSIKLDHPFTDNNRISYCVNPGREERILEGPLPGPLSDGNVSFREPVSHRVNHHYIFRPNLTNHFTFGFSAYIAGWDNPQQKGHAKFLGLRGINTEKTDGFPVVRFTGGYTTLSGPAFDAKTSGRSDNFVMRIKDDINYIRGRHEFKFGFDLRRPYMSCPYPGPNIGCNEQQTQGYWDFSSLQTTDPNNRTQGHPVASFLLGAVSRVARVETVTNDTWHYRYYAWYFQDTLRLTRRLTLTLGVRYDLPLARFLSPGDQQSSFEPDSLNPAAGNLKGAMVFAGKGPGRFGRRRFGDIDTKEIQPRFGVAFQATPKTVIRGGYGMYYGPVNALTGGLCRGC